MKYHTISLTAVAVGLALVLTGCETPSGRPDNTATGALVGGAAGAGIGAIAGGHEAGEGALIGGAIGALTGALVGHSIDQQHRSEGCRRQRAGHRSHDQYGERRRCGTTATTSVYAI